MMTTILFIGGGIVFFLLAVGAIVSMMGEKSLVEERLGPYFDEQELAEKRAQQVIHEAKEQASEIISLAQRRGNEMVDESKENSIF